MNFAKKIKSIAVTFIGFIIVTPLISPPFVLFPDSYGKSVLMIVAIALIIPCLASLFMRKSLNKIKLSWITIGLILYLAVGFISIFTGVDSIKSFWGDDVRAMGWLVLAIMSVFFFSLIMLFDKAREWRVLIWAFIGVGFIASLISLVNLFTLGPHRAMSTFGNPILFANFSLFPFFLALERISGENTWRGKVIAGLFSITILAGVLLPESRGAVLGLFAGLATIGAYSVLRSKQKKVRQGAWAMAFLFIIAMAVSWVYRDSTWLRVNTPFLHRVVKINLSETSANQRLMIWNMGFEGFLERPLLGWGLENFDYVFDKYFDARLTKFGLTQTWSDRAHNQFLDILVMEGLVGFSAYAILFIGALVLLWKKSRDVKHMWQSAALSGALVSYAGQGFFAFDGPATLMAFMLTLAYIHWYTVEKGQSNSHVRPDREPVLNADSGLGLTLENARPFILRIAIILSIVISVLLLFAVYRGAQASNLMLAIERLPAEAVNEQLRLAEASLGRWSPHRDSLRQRFANLVFERTGNNLGVADRARMLQAGIDEIKLAIEDHPEKFSYQFTFGNLLTKAAFAVDQSFAESAAIVLSSAIKYSPTRPAIYFQRGNISLLFKNYDEAINYYSRAVDLAPEVAQGLYLKGIAMTYTDKRKEGLDLIYKSMTMQHSHYTNSLIDLNHIASVAVDEEHYRLATYVFAVLVYEYPEDDKNWDNLKIALSQPDYDRDFVISTLVSTIYSYFETERQGYLPGVVEKGYVDKANELFAILGIDPNDAKRIE